MSEAERDRERERDQELIATVAHHAMTFTGDQKAIASLARAVLRLEERVQEVERVAHEPVAIPVADILERLDLLDHARRTMAAWSVGVDDALRDITSTLPVRPSAPPEKEGVRIEGEELALLVEVAQQAFYNEPHGSSREGALNHLRCKLVVGSSLTVHGPAGPREQEKRPDEDQVCTRCGVWCRPEEHYCGAPRTSASREEGGQGGLLPCPFCGGKAALTNVRMSNHSFKVGCYNEPCWRPGTDYYTSEADARDAWNRRPPSSPTSALTPHDQEGN